MDGFPQTDERYLFVNKLSSNIFNRPCYQAMHLMIWEGDLIYIDALDRLGHDYDGIIAEWKYITREVGADIVYLDNETLFDSRKFRTMSDFGKVMEDQFLSLLAYAAEKGRKKNRQRQIENIEIAKADGVKFGHSKQGIGADFIRVYQEWKFGATTAAADMKRLDM